jgi:hypothetical protein
MRVVIPTDLKEITLSQYKRYQKVVADNADDETYICIQMVAIFCNLEVADVMKLPAIEFADIVKTIAQTLDQSPALTRTFKMNGVNYGFIPNMQRISLGEHATIDTCMGKDELTELMLSVMYRPITKSIKVNGEKYYEIEEFTGDESLALNFNDTPMHIVRGAMVFFWTLFSELLNHTLCSIPKMAAREKLNLEEVLPNAGDGYNLLSQLGENLKLEGKKFQKSLFLNHSRYYLT